MEVRDKVTAIILRERLPNEKGEATGWLILLAKQTSVRQILAVLTYEVGLNYAREFTRLLASKYNISVTYELASDEKAVFVNTEAAQADYGTAI
jgi:hypothetical protein